MSKEELAERVIAYINKQYESAEAYYSSAKDEGLKHTAGYRLGNLGAYSDVRTFVYSILDEK
jgi:hypothetical protein